MQPEWTELREEGQSPGWVAGRQTIRKVLEEVHFHANLKAGKCQKVDEGNIHMGGRQGQERAGYV